MDFVRFGFALVGVVSLCLGGCGGGGGGGGGGDGGGGSANASFTLDRNTVAFSSATNGITPPAQQVSGTILNVDSAVFLTVVTSSNGVASAMVELTGPNTGALTIFPKSPATLGVGTFTDNVVVNACLDSACSRPIAGSPQTITVTHTVTAGNTPAPTFAIGGSVAGLVGSLVLQDNLGSRITVSTDGSFTFPLRRAGGDAYQVAVFTQPPGQTCVPNATSGVVVATDVSNIRVNCTTLSVSTYRIGATVTGLTGSLVLTNNGGDNLTLSGDGTFAFATQLPSGATYQVTVATQPPSQLCTVFNGSGSVAAANVNVTVTCRTKYSVGGAASGLTGTVVLQNNGGDNLSVSGSTTFVFSTSLLANAGYSVTVLTQPTGQFCRVLKGAGTIGTAPVTSVKVVCNSLPASKYAYIVTSGQLLINGRTPSGDPRTITGVLAQFTIDPSGALVPMTPATVSGVVDPRVVAVDPSGRYVYVTTVAGSVLQYTIGVGGELVAMSPASVTAGINPGDVKIDPAGKFVYVVNNGTSGSTPGSVSTPGSISQYSIAADGHLVPLTPAELPTANVNPGILLIDPSGKYAYISASNFPSNTVVLQYTIGSDGTLTPMTPSSISLGTPFARATAIDAFGRSLYFVDGLFSNILPYSIGDDGALTPRSSVTAQRQGPGFVGEATGTYAYVGAIGFIFRYNVNADGSIPQEPSSMVAADDLRCVVTDLSAKYVYACAGDPQNKLLQYTIGSDGTLAPMATPSVDVPLNPGSIAISP